MNAKQHYTAYAAIQASREENRTVSVNVDDQWGEEDIERLYVEADEVGGEDGVLEAWGEDWRVVVDLNGVLDIEVNDSGWCVRCYAGGRWWPDEEAQDEIARGVAPAFNALQMCRYKNHRGEWHN